MKRLALCGSLMLLLAACQPMLKADVTRFYAAPAVPAGKNFVVVTDTGQTGDLEFLHYAGYVAGGLQSVGFVPAPQSLPSADLVVLVHYGNSGSHTEVRSEPGPYYGLGGPRWGWHGYPAPEITSNTYYAQYLELSLLDGQAWRNNERRVLFQGRAYADSDIRDLNVVFPYLVKAIFQGYPGVNGQTVRVSVPVDQRP